MKRRLHQATSHYPATTSFLVSPFSPTTTNITSARSPPATYLDLSSTANPTESTADSVCLLPLNSPARFMQSDLPEVSKTSSSQNPPSNPTSTSQHGIHRSRSSASPRSLSRERADGSQSLDDEQDSEGRDTNNASADTAVESEGDTQLKSPPRRGKSNNNSSYIGNLPNEILTHALSHLPATDLSSVALVSQRFHALVTTPHAWRAAFARFFPGTPIETAPKTESFRTDKRAFCRLTALATWRSEYILRTRLLRSLSRGKPMQTGSSSSTPRGTRYVANCRDAYTLCLN